MTTGGSDGNLGAGGGADIAVEGPPGETAVVLGAAMQQQSVALLIAYTAPSGPMSVGVYASPVGLASFRPV